MSKRLRYQNRRPVVVPASIEIQAKGDHVVMVFPFDTTSIPPGGKGTIGIRFVSPEHLLGVFKELIDAAAEVWPDNPYMQEYKREDD